MTGRIVSFTHSSRRTQFDNMFLLLRILSEYEAAHAVSFPSILIVRKDLAFKQSLRPFLLDTRLYSDDGEVEHGVAFAWREINGEWRLFSTQRVSKDACEEQAHARHAPPREPLVPSNVANGRGKPQ